MHSRASWAGLTHLEKHLPAQLFELLAGINGQHGGRRHVSSASLDGCVDGRPQSVRLLQRSDAFIIQLHAMTGWAEMMPRCLVS